MSSRKASQPAHACSADRGRGARRHFRLAAGPPDSLSCSGQTRSLADRDLDNVLLTGSVLSSAGSGCGFGRSRAA